MDYKKLHKDTITKLQQMVNSGEITVEVARRICADFVPESEDERIRKEIIATIHLYYGEPLEDEAKEMIAWLEKQVEPTDIPADAVLDGNEDGFIAETIRYKREKHGEQKPNPCENCGIATNNCQKFPCAIRDGEQKPVDKVDPKFKVGDWIICRNGEDASYQITDSIPTGYIIKGDDGIIHSVTFEQLVNCNATLCVIQNQNPAWSEEDEMILSSINLYIRKARDYPHFDKKNIEEAINWLKSLKDRVQPKQEWSEENKCMLNNVIDTLKPLSKTTHSGYAINSMIDWLKSLRPQNTWKPSDEQIKGIKCAIKTLQHQLNIGDKRLNSLYDALKKLRG